LVVRKIEFPAIELHIKLRIYKFDWPLAAPRFKKASTVNMIKSPNAKINDPAQEVLHW